MIMKSQEKKNADFHEGKKRKKISIFTVWGAVRRNFFIFASHIQKCKIFRRAEMRKFPFRLKKHRLLAIADASEVSK